MFTPKNPSSLSCLHHSILKSFPALPISRPFHLPSASSQPIILSLLYHLFCFPIFLSSYFLLLLFLHPFTYASLQECSLQLTTTAQNILSQYEELILPEYFGRRQVMIFTAIAICLFGAKVFDAFLLLYDSLSLPPHSFPSLPSLYLFMSQLTSLLPFPSSHSVHGCVAPPA